MIYMDHNATTPMDEDVLNAMMPYFSRQFGNASSAHKAGADARNAVESARQTVAEAIGANPKEIIFTSGGTEADNLAIIGLKPRLKCVLVSSVEHDAVLKATASLRKAPIQSIRVDSEGRLDLDRLKHDLMFYKDHDIGLRVLVSVMHANNETGNVMDVRTVSDIATKYDAIVHTDAVQSFGKIPVNVDDLGVDMLSISAHKIYGPKGVGALYVRDGIKINPLIRGGHQERDLRAGTENVPAIVGFGKAVEIAMRDMEKNQRRMRNLTTALLTDLRLYARNYVGCWMKLNTAEMRNIGNTLSVNFDGVDGDALVMMLDQWGICVSRGAACESGTPGGSHVLKAMGRSEEEAAAAIRISLGRGNDMQQVLRVTLALREIVADLRG